MRHMPNAPDDNGSYNGVYILYRCLAIALSHLDHRHPRQIFATLSLRRSNENNNKNSPHFILLAIQIAVSSSINFAIHE